MNFNFDLSANLSHSSSYFSSFGRSNLPSSPGDQVVHERDDLFFSDDEENDPKPRLPLFGRCPLTNRAFLDHTPPSRKPLKSATNSPYSPAKMSSPYSPAKMSSPYSPYSLYSPSKAFSPIKGSNNYSPYYREERLASPELDLFGRSRLLMDVSSRMPLLQISSNVPNYEQSRGMSPKKPSWSQVARKTNAMMEERTPPGFHHQQVPQARNVSTNLFPTEENTRGENLLQLANRKTTIKAAAAAGTVPASSANTSSLQAKPSLDEVPDDSLVAMTNKHGKGKYWFKSGCPTPDPRWPARQQLMIGPIPGDVEYATLRSAFLSKGHTIHLFIQNNQAWLEKNQEKFGKKQVKFGYVVYTEPEVARRLLSQGHVLVGHARVAVKEMDGQPALFNN